MMKQLVLFLGLGIIAISPAQAGVELATALSSKKVCERADGFIQATPGNEEEAARLVDKVNAKRKAIYSDIAAKEGLDPLSVGIAMAEQERVTNPGKFCR
jgi:uncharacterized protein YdbL (DUF1318 family)